MTTITERLARFVPRTAKGTGLLVLAALLCFALLAFNKPRVETTLSPGDGLRAEFSQAYKLVPYESRVKMAGVEVGTVTGVRRTDGNRAMVSMKIGRGTRAKLGTEPEANVRPTLVLGGAYYVELVKGGEDRVLAENSTIPTSHTSVPVELDKVLSTITPDAAEAIQGTVSSLDDTLASGGTKEVRRFLSTAPGTLDPATEVLTGLQGKNPDTDLTALVTGVRNTARALGRQDGRISTILEHLATTSAALDATRSPVGRAVADGPRTLDVTRAGLADLDGTLDELTTTAESFGPSARALDDLLDKLGPVLQSARPVIADARVVTRDARPIIETLVPTADRADQALDDIKGPVLDRLDGDIKKAILTPWHGTGVYEGGGNDHPLYQEIGFFFSDTADAFKFHDNNGAMGRLMAGVGVNTPSGIVSMPLGKYLQTLGVPLPFPQEGANKDEPKPVLPTSPSSGKGPLQGQPTPGGLLPLFDELPGLLSSTTRNTP